MNLKELKKMIAEEYRYWMAEQPAPGAPAVPGVEVGPNDTMGGDDSEATLRQIYDMLKAYFEGGASTATPADDMDMDDMDDMGDMDDADNMDEDMYEDMDEEKEDDEKKDKKEGKKDDDKEDKKELKERFQKLANIVKG